MWMLFVAMTEIQNEDITTIDGVKIDFFWKTV
jgi:hypothetical protein